MADIVFGEPLNPNCPMGQIVHSVLAEAVIRNYAQQAEIAQILARRANDKDPEVRKLCRALITELAKARGVDLTRMPWIETRRQ